MNNYSISHFTWKMRPITFYGKGVQGPQTWCITCNLVQRCQSVQLRIWPPNTMRKHNGFEFNNVIFVGSYWDLKFIFFIIILLPLLILAYYLLPLVLAVITIIMLSAASCFGILSLLLLGWIILRRLPNFCLQGFLKNHLEPSCQGSIFRYVF